MSNTTRRISWSPVIEWTQRLGAIITVVAIAVFGFWGGHFLLPGQEHDEPETAETEVQASMEFARVTLPKEKLAAAKLDTAIVKKQPFQAHKAVPGSITYDATRKVELRATVSSVVKQTLVKATQSVEQGQAILVLTGPEVGSARNEISKCKAAVELLTREYNWILDAQTNIRELLLFLDQSPTSDQITARFEKKNLGDYRDEILSAYADVKLAERISARTIRLEEQGAIAGKTVDERRNGLEIANAKFDSIREKTMYQVTQRLGASKAKLDAEEKHLEICREELAALLGPHAESDSDNEEHGMTEFVLRAPRSGRIVELPAVESSRFEPGEVMAVIADTSVVWVEAQISQRDWHSMKLQEDQTLRIRIPALPDDEFIAVVRHLGTTVSKTTMAIPLVAELKNPGNQFRPGMSAWVDLPTSVVHSAITIPTGGVQRNEMESFVFVQVDDRTFERRSVTVGFESSDRIEINSGLKVGETVVVEGAFFLKSELLLAEQE